MAEPTYIKKEDVSTDNIYGYDFDYETGEFSGYWLKFKYVEVPMDTKDPFAPEQNDNAYPVYDAYIFENELRDTKNLITSLSETNTIDFFYVEKSVYQTIKEDEDDPKFFNNHSILPYEVTNGIMTVNKFYIPDIFNIENYKPIEFGTLNITQDANQNISAELQTDTDCTGKDIYVFLADRDNTVLDLKLKADSEDPTKLVFDDEYEDMIYDDTYLDENTTGTCTLEVYVEENQIDYTIDYSWTNEYVEYITQVDDTYEDYNINLFSIYEDPLTFGVEYTGHAVSSPSYAEGLNIITSKDYSSGIDWCKFYIDDTNHFKIDIYDGTNSSLVLWADIPQDFDFTEDHTYRFSLAVDTSNVNNGIIRFIPELMIDGVLLHNIWEEFGNTYYVEFDVSGGTTAVETFQTQFMSNIWMFRYDPNSDNPSQDGYHAVGPNWEISQIKILYMDGSSLLDIGDDQEHVLTAVSDKSLSDGENEYTLEPMSTLIPEEPDEPVEPVDYVTNYFNDEANVIEYTDRNMKMCYETGLLYSVSWEGCINYAEILNDDTAHGFGPMSRDFSNLENYLYMEYYCPSSAPVNGRMLRCYIDETQLGLFGLSPDFDIQSYHTYTLSLTADSTYIGQGILRCNFGLSIDGVIQDNLAQTTYIEFDISGGTETFLAWAEGFQSNLVLFNMTEGVTDEYVGRKQDCKSFEVNYSQDLQNIENTFTDTWEFESAGSMSNGTNTVSLVPMSSLIAEAPEETQEDPTK